MSPSKKLGRVFKTRPYDLFTDLLRFLCEHFAGQPGERAASERVLDDMLRPLRIRPIHLLAFDFKLQRALDMPQFDDLAARH